MSTNWHRITNPESPFYGLWTNRPMSPAPHNRLWADGLLCFHNAKEAMRHARDRRDADRAGEPAWGATVAAHIRHARVLVRKGRALIRQSKQNA